MANKLRYSDFAHRIDIDALINELELDLDEDGNELRGYCPLPWGLHKHGDTTGKFSINVEKRIYGCWVCGGGNLLDLVMSLKDLDPEPATKWLYQFADYEETDEEFIEWLDEALDAPEDRQPVMPYFNSRVLDRHGDAIGHPWLSERKISDNVAGSFRLRFNSESVRTNREDRYVGPSILFPHFWRGQLVGWQQRWLESEEDRPKWVPKYTMTPDFPKNETLYGYDRAQRWLHDDLSDEVVICESVPSTLFLWSYDIPAVATFGSSVADAQLRLLRTFPRVILAPDNDPAGVKWTNSLATYLEQYIDVVKLPPVSDESGADIGDLAEQPDLLKDYLSLAFDSIDELLA